jgi:predicted nicotinamide N-methyase
VITYSTPDGEVYIREQPSLIVASGTTGLRTWEASLLLSEWVLTQDLTGKRILELGAGTGLVGILAAKRGAKVTATDGSEMVVSRLRKNYEMNLVNSTSEVLWWGEENELLEETWDYIIGADITYDEEVCRSLSETYALALRQGGIGILAATVRNHDTFSAFIRESGSPVESTDAESRGLHIETVPDWNSMKGIFFCNSPFPMRLLRISKSRDSIYV